MSSKQSGSVSFRALAGETGRKVQREHFAGRSERRTRASRVADTGSQITSETVALVRDMAGMMLTTAASVGEELVALASDLEPVVTQQKARRRRSGGSDAGAGTDASAAVLVLPDATADDSTSGDFVARNDGRDTLDHMGIRCVGLFGAEGNRIEPEHVTLPDAITLPPRSTATITCTVEVPKDTAGGEYVGLIDSPDYAGVQLLVKLNVV